MINIAICDDNTYQLQAATAFVNSLMAAKTIDYQITTFDSLSKLEDQVIKNNFNILILDIKYENEHRNGLYFARQCTTISPETQIIFLTSYVQFFQEAYLYDHIYYVLKDDMEIHLKNAINKALKKLNDLNNNSHTLSISFNRKHTIVAISDIVYMEKSLRKIKFYCKDITKYLPNLEAVTINDPNELFLDTYASFDDYLPILPENFIQTHRAYIVNIDYIKEIHNNDILLINKKLIPVSRKYRNDVNAYLTNHFLKK
ncbi:MAG: LytTR family DNA-binding domain-containing protein [Erysipelotrichaceae bacterium]|nr:LytTR family DNA-binding domain-containing protein [Erysipelotrichaceae bacterium]MDY5251507.1 LytTR family DNA-binding domain-containing protein [Erysipelotrichaceae bacterium]